MRPLLADRACQIEVGTPQRQATRPVAAEGVIFGTGFVGDVAGDAVDQVGVPGGSHGDAIGINRGGRSGVALPPEPPAKSTTTTTSPAAASASAPTPAGTAAAGKAVQAFRPPVACGDVQTHIFRGLHQQLLGFFHQGHAGDEVGDALFERQGNVLVRRQVLRG